MNWFFKVAQIEPRWWDNAQQHLDKIVQIQFSPPPPKNSPEEYINDIFYFPWGRNIVQREYGNNSDRYRIMLFRRSPHQRWYNCIIDLDYSGYPFVLSGVTCTIQRIDLDKGQNWDTAKILGPITPDRGDWTPFGIIQTIKTLINSDFGDDSGDEQLEPEPSPYTGVESPSDLVFV